METNQNKIMKNQIQEKNNQLLIKNKIKNKLIIMQNNEILSYE